MPVFKTLFEQLKGVPSSTLARIKDFFKKDKLVISDISFKIATKITPSLLLLMLIFTLIQYNIRGKDIDCAHPSFDALHPPEPVSGDKGAENLGEYLGSGLYERAGRKLNLNEVRASVNDYCWNIDTFVVVKGFESVNKKKTTFPGILPYNKSKDKIIRLNYYKFTWLFISIAMLITYLPYYIWKMQARPKIRPIIKSKTNIDKMILMFTATIGFNTTFPIYYLLCKIFAIFTPYLLWTFLCGFLNPRYQLYGIDVLKHILQLGPESDTWVSPMDKIFPRMAKCEWAKVGYGGGLEIMAIQCQLPLNNINQWSFFVFWWWMLIMFIINAWSCLILLLNAIPVYRHSRYRLLLKTMCKSDFDKLIGNGNNMDDKNKNGTAEKNNKGNGIEKINDNIISITIIDSRKHDNDNIYANMDFGDWLVLTLIKNNLDDFTFRNFIYKFAETENSILEFMEVNKC